MNFAFESVIEFAAFLALQGEVRNRRTLDVHTSVAENMACVAVALHCGGSNIALPDWNDVFQPGFRVAGARAPNVAISSGQAGLWEAKSIIEGHGGRLVATSTACSTAAHQLGRLPCHAVSFSICLPVGTAF